MRFVKPNKVKSFVILFCTFIISCSQPAPLYPLPPNATILAFGDSLTAGVGTSADNSYPAILEKMTGFKVINGGVPGDTSTKALIRLPALLKKYHPNLVIICLGGNDRIHRESFDVTITNLKTMIEMSKKEGAQVVLIGVPELKLNLNIPDFYQEIAKEYNVPVDSETLRTLLKNRQYKSDTIHLNQQGYYLLAEKIKLLLHESGAMK